jgi:glycosyltransferase involved in cell wall biosynthesis
MTPVDKPRIALWFRYGPAEHTELFHAMPEIVTALAETCEVHYFGWASFKPVPLGIAQHAIIHHLPGRVNRSSPRDVIIKTMLWIAALPWIGLYCRFRRFHAVYIDETVPLTGLVARIFFGRHVAMTVADFFPEIYFGDLTWLKPLVRLIRALELATWRQLPLIFTRAQSTKEYLMEQGVPADRVNPVYDPCDFTVYHPGDRAVARAHFGYKPDQLVLVHHGILHPNKGNERILRALAQVKADMPQLRYLLVGDGPDMGRLQALTRELGLEDRVKLTGWLPGMGEVNQALNAGDIGLVMRVGMRSDDFHVTGALVHNMACGLPILCARLGGTSEIIREGVEGLLFDPNNMNEFLAKLHILAQDSDKRRQFGLKAESRAHELFDITRVTRRTVDPLVMLCRLSEPAV